MESSDPAFVLLDRDSLLRELVRVVNERDAADHLVDVLVDERAALLVRLDFTLQLSEPAPGNLPRLASATPSPRGRGVLDSESSARAVPVGSDGLAGTAQGRFMLLCNPPARYLLECAALVGMGSRVGFGFGRIRVRAVEGRR